jgi:hypothetical protein
MSHFLFFPFFAFSFFSLSLQLTKDRHCNRGRYRSDPESVSFHLPTALEPLAENE